MAGTSPALTGRLVPRLFSSVGWLKVGLCRRSWNVTAGLVAAIHEGAGAVLTAWGVGCGPGRCG